MGLVVLAQTDEATAKQVKRSLARRDSMEFALARSLEETDQLVTDRSPYVVVLGAGVPPDQALEMAGKLEGRQPPVAVVLVPENISTDLLRQAIRIGVKDVLSAQDPVEDVAAAVESAYDMVKRWREAVGDADAAGAPAPPHRAKVITVFSTKGGVGKTTLASNLGVVLSEKLGYRTVILDLDLQFGDLGVMLQLVPEHTILDAVQTFDRLDEEMLQGYLVSHQSGLRALLAPVQPEDAESISSSRIAHIISLIRNVADYLIVDTPASFSEVVLAALDSSDQIYALATMDVPSIKNARVAVQKLRQLGYDSMVHLVLNRADSKVGLGSSDVERVVECDIVGRIPSDRLVPRAINKGVPVVTEAPKSAVARSFCELADVIVRSNGEVSRGVA